MLIAKKHEFGGFLIVGGQYSVDSMGTKHFQNCYN